MNKNIGENMCQYRKYKRMTQEEFASRLGVTPQAVSKWERGTGLPDVSLIEGICRTLDISANTLLGIEDNKIIENDNVTMKLEITNNMFAEPLVLEFGEDMIPCVVSGLETDYINTVRSELVKSTGILMPVLRLKDNIALEKSAYRILSYDKILYEDRIDIIDENTYKIIVDRTAEECRKNYAAMINKHIVKIMMDNIKELYPGSADDLVPDKISYLQLQRKLQDKLKKGQSIRDMIHILEEMEENL